MIDDGELRLPNPVTAQSLARTRVRLDTFVGAVSGARCREALESSAIYDIGRPPAIDAIRREVAAELETVCQWLGDWSTVEPSELFGDSGGKQDPASG